MYSFKTPDVNDALQRGIEHLLREGITETSRNGPVLVAPEPVCTEYTNPRARVLLSPTRDANPFFHFFEALWFLTGDNAIEFPCYFNSGYGRYSDDDRTMWDAYGWRWRRFFGWDQLEAIIAELRQHPDSRRCVLSMWNPAQWGEQAAPGWCTTARAVPSTGGAPTYWTDWVGDFQVATHGGKAVPCNTHCYLDLRGGALNMTVCNRSNDALFGCYGANMVHMSIMQEYMAMRLGVPLGVYRQFSNNLHVYTDVFSREKLEQIAHECDTLGRAPTAGPAITSGFDEDLQVFMAWALRLIREADDDQSSDALKTPFFTEVARPMFDAWYWRKQGHIDAALSMVAEIEAPDWQRACREWIERRKK